MPETKINHLRCDYLVDPLGLDERSPRLSWQIESARRGARQTTYRIFVASSRDKLAAGDADRWDTLKIAGAQTTQVVYGGAPLQSRDECYWVVEAWDETGASVRSPVARWT